MCFDLIASNAQNHCIDLCVKLALHDEKRKQQTQLGKSSIKYTLTKAFGFRFHQCERQTKRIAFLKPKVLPITNAHILSAHIKQCHDFWHKTVSELKASCESTNPTLWTPVSNISVSCVGIIRCERSFCSDSDYRSDFKRLGAWNFTGHVYKSVYVDRLSVAQKATTFADDTDLRLSPHGKQSWFNFED